MLFKSNKKHYLEEYCSSYARIEDLIIQKYIYIVSYIGQRDLLKCGFFSTIWDIWRKQCEDFLGRTLVLVITGQWLQFGLPQWRAISLPDVPKGLAGYFTLVFIIFHVFMFLQNNCLYQLWFEHQTPQKYCFPELLASSSCSTQNSSQDA